MSGEVRYVDVTEQAERAGGVRGGAVLLTRILPSKKGTPHWADSRHDTLDQPLRKGTHATRRQLSGASRDDRKTRWDASRARGGHLDFG